MIVERMPVKAAKSKRVVSSLFSLWSRRTKGFGGSKRCKIATKLDVQEISVHIDDVTVQIGIGRRTARRRYGCRPW
jgi:hypothetical protein